MGNVWRFLRVMLIGVQGADYLRLKNELDALRMDHADLFDRFNRLQSRYAMRNARAVGEARAELERLAGASVARPRTVFDDLDAEGPYVVRR